MFSKKEGPLSSANGSRLTGWVCLGAIFLALAWRQHRFVDRYAVNMMYWDQWDLYRPFFEHRGLWGIFSYQFGPHRQGAGFLVTRVLAGMSGWNSRWDAFGVSFLLIAAALAGLWLALRCGVRSALSLAAIPLLFFNIHQYEGFVGPSNLSHGAMPVLLLMLYCLAWFVQDRRVRLVIQGALVVPLLFTGFAQMGGLLALVLAVLEMFQARRAGAEDRASGGRAPVLWNAAGLVLILGAFALFIHGFRFDQMDVDFRFPYNRMGECCIFVCLMLANSFGFAPHVLASILFGAGVALVLAFIGAWHGWRSWRVGFESKRASVVIFVLSGFALLYCADTAIGRVHLGLDAAPAASRYVTLLIPGGLAIWLHFATLKLRRAPMVGLVLALALVPATTRLSVREWASVRSYSEGRAAWKAAYLATHDEAKADQASHFQVYPHSVGDRLGFLERNHLNLFNGQPDR
jgi:hypothetical protein